MSRRMIALAAVGAAVVASLVVAATVSRETPDPPREQEEASFVDPGEQPGALILPFDAYELTPLETQIVESAEDVLITECMREEGYGWEALPLPSAQHADPPNLRRYGLTDPGDAARYGYHLPPPTDAAERREAVWNARDQLPRQESLAAFGEGGATGGCWGEAHSQILRDVPPDDSSLRVQYFVEAFDTARDDPETVTAINAWSACMEQAGFTYPGPLEAFSDEQWGPETRPTDHELAVAEADVRCKQETDLVEVWSGVEERVQRRMIRDNPDDFAGFGEWKETWLANAREVLDER